MTDETNNKLRAVFLAALMVLWVFAGTVALAGSAAAIEGNGSISNGDITPQDSSTNAQDVTYNSSFDIDNGTDSNNNSIGGVEVVLTDASGGTSGGSVDDPDDSDVDVTLDNGTERDVAIDGAEAVDNDGDGTQDSFQIEFENNVEPDDGSTLRIGIADSEIGRASCRERV